MAVRSACQARVVFLTAWMAAAGGAWGCGSNGASPSRDGGLVLPDGGVPSDATAGGTLPQASSFADVNVPVNFTQPVWLPPPATTIQGDTASLVGSWIELDPDGSLCTPSRASYNGMCFHLDVAQDSGGAVGGTIHADPSTTVTQNGPQLSGPFAAATDPSVGYPTTVSPSDYFYAQQLLPAVDYQILDGVVASGSFAFWFSPLDLWSGWCALQTPSAWNVRGQVEYRCVSQTADPSTTDLGKLALCTSASDGPECSDQNGFEEPCVCFDDAGMVDVGLPLCGRSVCECSATECRAALRTSQMNVQLTIEGNKLVGNAGFGILGMGMSMAFQRVMP